MDRGGEGEVVGLVARGNDGALAGDLRLHLGITRVGQPELQGLEPLRPRRGAAVRSRGVDAARLTMKSSVTYYIIVCADGGKVTPPANKSRSPPP